MQTAVRPQILTLQNGRLRLKLLPELGGGIAAWDYESDDGWTPLLRPWDGVSEDRYTLACFPLIPWSNRITAGGFEHEDRFYPIRPNRSGETYPIHGDGWLQAWQVMEQTGNRVRLRLESHAYDGNPYDYIGTLIFLLREDGLEIELTATHTGAQSLPYGLGLHPYFMRNDMTRLRMKTSGVWLSGSDPIPVAHTERFPPTWDYNEDAPLNGPLIDNCFTGGDGNAVMSYPDRQLSIAMSIADCNGYSLMYRPPGLSYFCLEPITHPIDAFHMPDRPGLAVLSTGQSLTLKMTLTIKPA